MKECPGPLIRDDVEASDSAYQNLRRDHPILRADREFVESLWFEYWPYAGDDFYRDAPRDFVARFWEMDLACSLMRAGFTIEERRAHGPDVCVIVDGRRVWIEAVAPTSGGGADAAQDLAYDGIAREFDGEDGILLRIRNGIEEKARKYKSYREDGIIGPDEPYVIAINLSRVPSAIVEEGVPYIVKAVYPIGAPHWQIDLATESVAESHAHRPAVQKASGSEVATTCFLEEQYSGISGVLYSRADAYNRRDDWHFVHNMVGANRLARGWLKIGKEYWPEKGEIKITRHSGSED